MKTNTKVWIGLIVLIFLSPLGLILPDKLGAGSAWGEWGGDEMQKMVGYVPAGMARLGELWKAPFPDYAFKGQKEASLQALSFSYIVSGLLGVAIVVVAIIIIGRIISRRENSSPS